MSKFECNMFARDYAACLALSDARKRRNKEPEIDAVAYALGAAAFGRGVACAPALDVEFGKLPALPIGPESLNRLTSWHRGWAAANLACKD